MALAQPLPEIGLVLYPHVQLAGVYGLTDLFTVANRISRERLGEDAPLLRVSHLRYVEPGGSMVRSFDTRPGEHGDPSILVLPPSLQHPDRFSDVAGLALYLKARHAAGAILASVCAGTFLLAEAGVLDGRLATTHWAHADALSERFSEVRVDAEKLIIDDGDIITAGGLMAWTDLGLTLVERLLGAGVMMETARAMLIDPPGREQRSYSRFSPRLMHGDAAVLKVQHWLQQASPREASVGAMARQAGLEERTFQRRFRRATGLAPVEYCQLLRIGKARDMLETTSLSVEQIAARAGYTDPKSFRKVFARITGLTPSEYRRRFSLGRAPAGSPDARNRSPKTAPAGKA